MAARCPNCSHPTHLLDRLREQYQCERRGSVLCQPDKLRVVPAKVVILAFVLGTPTLLSILFQGNGLIFNLLCIFIYSLLGGIVFLFFILQRIYYTPVVAQKSNRRFCTNCGYDIRGITNNRCPECGTISVFDSENASTIDIEEGS